MRPMHPHHMHPVHSPYPDNWPWSEPVPPRPPHLCCPPPPPPPWAPHPCPPPPFIPTPEGFCAQEPENGTPVSGLAKAIRHSKRAFLSLTSVPALFSVDVQDGDIVKPVPADDSFKDLLCAMGPATKLPDAVWVPAFRTVDSQPDTQTDGEAPTEPAKPVLSDYTPSFYGVAYRGVSRVMIGPVVTHPRFVFHTGDKVYADANGDLTLTENENFVGVCLAPGSLYLLPQTSAFSEFLEAYRQEIIETATKEIIESIEGGELDGGSITVTVPGTTTDRPLSDRLQDVVNIKDFGAVGDGATDNAMAFFLAMQRAQELGSNVCLFIPVGDYLTTQLPTVPCYGPGSIIFDGQTYAPFELLFAIKGGISKDTNGRYKVNPAEFSEDTIRDLIDKILGAGGDGENPGGGGIGIDEDGNIVIDFGSLTEEQIQELLEILNKYLPDLNKPVVDPNGGLTNTNLGLAIKPATHGGLYTTSLGASILLDADSGLKLSPAGVSVQVASAGGLQVDSAGVAMKVKASGGIVVDAEGAAVRVATPTFPGIMRPDNTTCTVENGVLSSRTAPYNTRVVITESNAAWPSPVTGWAQITLIGGGGGGCGGGGSIDTAFSGGGGGFGERKVVYVYLTEGSTYACTIGAGGAGGTSNNNGNATPIASMLGKSGGTTSFVGDNISFSAVGGGGAGLQVPGGMCTPGIGGGDGVTKGLSGIQGTLNTDRGGTDANQYHGSTIAQENYYGGGGEGGDGANSTTTIGANAKPGIQGAIIIDYYDPNKENA